MTNPDTSARQFLTWAVVGRLALSALVTAGTALGVSWVVSFAVSDYVVKANTSSLNETLAGLRSSLDQSNAALQGSIDRLNQSVEGSLDRLNASMEGSLNRINDSVRANQAELIGIRDEVGGLRAQSSEAMTEIQFVRRDLGNVQRAVQDYGISIPAFSKVDGGFVINTGKWDDLTAKFGLSGDGPVFLELKK